MNSKTRKQRLSRCWWAGLVQQWGGGSVLLGGPAEARRTQLPPPALRGASPTAGWCRMSSAGQQRVGGQTSVFIPLPGGPAVPLFTRCLCALQARRSPCSPARCRPARRPWRSWRRWCCTPSSSACTTSPRCAALPLWACLGPGGSHTLSPTSRPAPEGGSPVPSPPLPLKTLRGLGDPLLCPLCVSRGHLPLSRSLYGVSHPQAGVLGTPGLTVFPKPRGLHPRPRQLLLCLPLAPSPCTSASRPCWSAPHSRRSLGRAGARPPGCPRSCAGSCPSTRAPWTSCSSPRCTRRSPPRCWPTSSSSPARCSSTRSWTRVRAGPGRATGVPEAAGRALVMAPEDAGDWAVAGGFPDTGVCAGAVGAADRGLGSRDVTEHVPVGAEARSVSAQGPSGLSWSPRSHSPCGRGGDRLREAV